MAELVTGEAVEVDLRVARTASRACALLLDLMFQMVILNFALYVVSMTALIADEAWTVGLTILTMVMVLVGYPTAFETLSRGRTLGKMALGLRVVGDDGGAERFRQALARGLTGFIEFWLLMGAPAVITSLFNRRGKRLGDLLAGTVVIQERVPSSVLFGPVAVMPPQLAGWAQGLELSRVSDGLALTARQYLTRFWELIPEVRDTMGQRIADQVVAVISPPPPPGVRPEILLSAVLAERSRRERWRLHRLRERRAHLPGAAVPAPVPAMAVAGPPPAPPLPPPLSPPGPGQPQFLPPPHYGAGPYAQVLSGPRPPYPSAPQHPHG